MESEKVKNFEELKPTPPKPSAKMAFERTTGRSVNM